MSFFSVYIDMVMNKKDGFNGNKIIILSFFELILFQKNSLKYKYFFFNIENKQKGVFEVILFFII